MALGLSASLSACSEGKGAGNTDSDAGTDWSDEIKSWCKPVKTPAQYVCAAPIAAGQPCDVHDPMLSFCGADRYCAFAEGTTAGTCKERGKTGAACNPLYENDDCLGSDCEYVFESFMCGTASQAVGDVYCHPLPN